jgi:hypothetical protein
MSTTNEPPFYEDAPLALLSSPAFLTGKVGFISGLKHKPLLKFSREMLLPWERLI